MTRKNAIRRFCLECMGGSVREVRLCTAPNCPLYPYRMGNKNKAVNGEKAHENEE